jgi:hypothetical protein
MRPVEGMALLVIVGCTAPPGPAPRLTIEPSALSGGLALDFNRPAPAPASITYSAIDSTPTYRYQAPAGSGIQMIDVLVGRDGRPLMFEFDFAPGADFDALAQRYAQTFGVPGTVVASGVVWVDSDSARTFALARPDPSGRVRAYLGPFFRDDRGSVRPDRVKRWEYCMSGYWPLCALRQP